LSLKLLKEGAVSFYAEPSKTEIGPAAKVSTVFYNPAMRHSRDVSVCLLASANPGKDARLLDGMAASGVRGMRLAKEARPEAAVEINDRSEQAYEAILRAIKRNKLPNAQARCEDVRALLHAERYDYVDIDPFGTPVPYIDPALRGTKSRGILAVTATDTAALCGTYPRTTERRYMARPLLSECAHELGLRILVGYIIRLAAMHDIAAEPLVCYSREHYFRTYFRVRNGARRADELLKSMGYANFEPEGKRWISAHHETKEWAGPLWTGEIFDAKLLKEMKGFASEKRLDIVKDLDIWIGEAGAPPLHYDVPTLAHIFRKSQPRQEKLLEGIRAMGYKAVRTHFDLQGIRTEAPVEDLRKLF